MADWEGVIAVEDTATTDGRLIVSDALTWETPIPLTVDDDRLGYYIARIGTVTEVWRDGVFIRARGVADRSLNHVGVGMTLDQVSAVDNDLTLVRFTGGRIRAVHAYVVRGVPVWPECYISTKGEVDD